MSITTSKNSKLFRWDIPASVGPCVKTEGEKGVHLHMNVSYFESPVRTLSVVCWLVMTGTTRSLNAVMLVQRQLAATALQKKSEAYFTC